MEALLAYAKSIGLVGSSEIYKIRATTNIQPSIFDVETNEKIYFDEAGRQRTRLNYLAIAKEIIKRLRLAFYQCPEYLERLATNILERARTLEAERAGKKRVVEVSYHDEAGATRRSTICFPDYPNEYGHILIHILDAGEDGVLRLRTAENGTKETHGYNLDRYHFQIKPHFDPPPYVVEASKGIYPPRDPERDGGRRSWDRW